MKKVNRVAIHWKADLEELNENIEIPARVFAEVKPSTQATAGPIYKCLAAVSKDGRNRRRLSRKARFYRRFCRVRRPTFSSGPAPSRSALARTSPLP